MKVLVVDKVHPSLFSGLEEIGVKFEYQPEIKRPEILQKLQLFDGLILRSKTKIDAELIQSGKNLRFVARAGAGLDGIDEQFLMEKGIALIHAAEGNRDAVGEHTLGLLLALLNNIPKANSEINQKIWIREANRGYEIKGKTIGIYGFGNMGQAFAEKLAGFACDIIAYDKYLKSWPNLDVKKVNLDTLKYESEILSIHLPLTQETRGMIDSTFFDKCVQRPWFLNTSRGEIVQLKALSEAIKNGKIRGAALDVLENENFSNLSSADEKILENLISTQKVIFSPHVAGWTHESYLLINEVLIKKIKNLISY